MDIATFALALAMAINYPGTAASYAAAAASSANDAEAAAESVSPSTGDDVNYILGI